MCTGPLWGNISKLRLQGENDERGIWKITILSQGTIEVSKLSLMWTGGWPKFAKMLGNREIEMNGTDKENQKMQSSERERWNSEFSVPPGWLGYHQVLDIKCLQDISHYVKSITVSMVWWAFFHWRKCRKTIFTIILSPALLPKWTYSNLNSWQLTPLP